MTAPVKDLSKAMAGTFAYHAARSTQKEQPQASKPPSTKQKKKPKPSKAIKEDDGGEDQRKGELNVRRRERENWIAPGIGEVVWDECCVAPYAPKGFLEW